MKTGVLFVTAMIFTLIARAQTVDSVDNIILKIPANWEVTKQATFIGLTLFNKSQNSFCQVAIYQQQPSAGDKYASFQKEWNELLLTSYETSAIPAPQPKKLKNANVLYYGAQVRNKANQLPYYSELHVVDCGNSVQSILITTGSKKHLQYFDSLWQSLITAVRKNTTSTGNTNTNTQPSANTNSPFSGKWGKSASSPGGLAPGTVITNAGYIKCEYDFKPNGTYTLRYESRSATNDYTLINENGTYKATGQQLVITPTSGKFQVVDRDGKLKKSYNLDISKRTYAWQLYFFEGLNETQLVLKPQKDYMQDGGFSETSLFPNSYLFSQQYKPEWRFK